VALPGLSRELAGDGEQPLARCPLALSHLRPQRGCSPSVRSLHPGATLVCVLREAGAMTRSKAAVLFDLGSVLVDSRSAITGGINHALLEHGLAARPVESLLRYIGPPFAHAFGELTGQPAESKLVSSCVATYRRRYATASLQETAVVPGIADALAELPDGWRLAVTTSKPHAFAEPLLETLSLHHHFTAVCGPDRGARSEPKAHTIAAALRALGDPPAAVMVGDRSFDIVGAHACGIPTVGVSWGIGERTELEGAGAQMIIDAPCDLRPALELLLQVAPEAAWTSPPQS
jgi:phosphoglycolate phosphatase